MTKLEKIDKKMINRFLRETFSGVLPNDKAIENLKNGSNHSSSKNDLNDDVQNFIQQ